MGESLQHIELVNSILKFMKLMVNVELTCLIRVDLPDSNSKPPKVGEGYIPDLYFCNDEMLIIGEAKTSNDFDRKHSLEQYMSYIITCDHFEGEANMIVAVPWTEYISAKNLLRKIKKQGSYDLKIVVLNDLGRCETI
jgi:hypothetical protein